MEAGKPGSGASAPQTSATPTDGTDQAPEPRESPIYVLQDFFRQLLKCIKTMRMYQHQREKFPEFLRPAFQILQPLLKQGGTLTLKVEQVGFKFKNQTVYQEEISDQNLGFIFFQEGVRLLKFHPGLTLEELLEFILICINASQAMRVLDQDLLGQLWKKGLKNIEYVVMQSYTVEHGEAAEGGEESTEEELQVEVDHIVNHIYESLTGKGSEDQIQYARVSIEDLDIDLEEIMQARGLRLAPASITPQLVSKFQNEIEAEEAHYLLPKLLRIIILVFSKGLDPAHEICLGDTYILLLDFFLLREDFDHIQLMMEYLIRNHKQETEGPGPWHRILARVREKMSDAERIHRLGQIMETTNKPEIIQKTTIYLRCLDRGAFPPMLEELENLNRPESRRLFCEVLVHFAADHLNLLESKLESPKVNMVRDVLSILDRASPAGKIPIVTKLLKHANMSIRIEALKLLSSCQDPQGIEILKGALQDRFVQIRLAAAEILARADPSQAEGILLAIVQEPGFREQPHQEQAGYYAALAMTESPRALEFFHKLLASKAILNKKKLQEDKLAVITGFAKSNSARACQFLIDELKAGLQDPQVTSAAERARDFLQKKLTGTPEGA